MLLKVSHIAPLSLAKTLCALQGAIGLLTGVFFTIISISKAVAFDGDTTSAETLFGVWSFIILPILNGGAGFLSGWLMATLYNFITRFNLAIELDLQE